MENQENTQTFEVPAGLVPAELTVTDLQNIRAIIDAACRRGAFGAAEMSAVGAAFSKLEAFLNAVTPPKDAEAEQAPTA